jgi:hypothetical protein
VAERLKTLPHDFEFIEDNRSTFTLVGDIRLDPRANCVQLLATAGVYPTVGEQYIVTPIYKPKAVRQWVGFQVDILHVNDGPDVQLTGDGYRLSDGTTQFAWDGAAWSPAGSTWNTEAQVAAHIASFPATSRQLQVLVRLSTTDQNVTPTLSAVRIAWVGKVEMFEDIVFRSLVPLMRTVRVVVDFAIKVAVPGGFNLDVKSSVAAASLKFNVADVEAVFNNNLDPDHYDNLLQSYNPSTGIATLATAVPVGQFAFCRLVLQPQVAVENTAQDFIEVETVPALQITNIEAVDSQPLSVETGIVNKGDGTAIVIPPPYRFTLRFTMIALTPGGVDLMRILRSVVELVESNPTITSIATDEQYRFWMINEFTSTTNPTDNNLQSMQAMFEIMDIVTFEKPSVVTKAVERLNIYGLGRVRAPVST